MDLDCCMQLIHKLFTSTVHPGREDLGTCMRCAASCLHKGRLQHLHLRTQHVLPGCVHLLLLLLLWRFWCWLAGILSQQGPQRLQQIWAQAVTQQLYMLDIWQSSLAVSNRLALTSQLQVPAVISQVATLHPAACSSPSRGNWMLEKEQLQPLLQVLAGKPGGSAAQPHGDLSTQSKVH